IEGGRVAIDFTCTNAKPGIYALCLTTPNDTQGYEKPWGYTTTCVKHIVEISRGHLDARHTEPLVLASPDLEGDIFFPHPGGDCAISLSMLYAGTEATLTSADNGREIAMTRLSDNSNYKPGHLSLGDILREAATPPADNSKRPSSLSLNTRISRGFYQLHLSRFSGKIDILELTDWKANNGWDDMSPYCFWTQKKESWFDFSATRHLLYPYQQELYLKPGTSAAAEFVVRNLGKTKITVYLTLEADSDLDSAVFGKLSHGTVTLAPDQAIPVNIPCTGPADGESRSLRLRVTCGDFTTYSTVLVKGDKNADAGVPMVMPYDVPLYRSLVYGHEIPGGEPYFDSQGREFRFDVRKLCYKDEQGVWHKAKIAGTDKETNSYSSKIAFDTEDRVYYIDKSGDKMGLAWSDDHGHTFNRIPLGPGEADIETFTGHNPTLGPPPVLLYTPLSSGRSNLNYDSRSFWRKCNLMILYMPTIKDGKVTPGSHIMITDKSIGTALHSGMASGLVTKGEKIHLIWGECTDINDKSITGVPTYTATYDKQTGKLSPPRLIGYGPPANDVHNTPSILADSQGYLHAFVGSHGAVFQYSRSLQPDSTDSWTEAKPIGNVRGGMTYIGAICDSNDILHLIYRHWQSDPDGSLHGYGCAELVHLHRAAQDDIWSAPRILCRPAFSEYSVYYHRFTVDRQGRFWLSVAPWTTYWFYRNDFEIPRFLMESPDNGNSWYLVK
ncbi:MAG: BNR-4 repeat-containing protein, partial [Victivallales bacterium]|nr:BNR-4 repeat-containing protein [Victivallales bacterium]